MAEYPGNAGSVQHELDWPLAGQVCFPCQTDRNPMGPRVWIEGACPRGHISYMIALRPSCMLCDQYIFLPPPSSMSAEQAPTKELGHCRIRASTLVIPSRRAGNCVLPPLEQPRSPGQEKALCRRLLQSFSSIFSVLALHLCCRRRIIASRRAFARSTPFWAVA